MFHFVYKIINKINGHYYIGVHSTYDIDDGYMGSGKIMKFALKKYGVSNFSREIIYSFSSRKEAFRKETELLDHETLIDPCCYNLVTGGGTNNEIYSKKAENIHEIPLPFFDDLFEYRIRPINPVTIQNSEILTSFGASFWGIICGPIIFEIINKLFNDKKRNKLANQYIAMLNRIPEYRQNIIIEKSLRSTLDKNRQWQEV